MILETSSVFSEEQESSIVVWKALGERWYAAVVSKATADRVGELVTKQGMDFAITTAKNYDYHSSLYIEHAVPWTRIGRSVREMRIGNLWIEIGKFYRNSLADLAYNALKKCKEGAIRLSVGFLTPLSQRKMGIYTKLLKFDTSLVLKPAHPETHIIVGGNKKMNELMQRVMKLLGPENEQEEEKAKAMLKELFATKSMDGLTTVDKAKDDKKKAFAAFLKQTKAEDKKVYEMLEKMVGEMPDHDGVKKAYATMKAKMEGYPDMEEEEEEPVEKSKSAGESVQTLLTAVAEIVDARITPLTEAIAGLSTASGQIVNLSERVKNLEADSQAAEVIAALVKRLPEFSLAQASRPSDTAETVPANETAELIGELQKRLDFDNDKPQHPLGHFIGGGGPE